MRNLFVILVSLLLVFNLNAQESETNDARFGRNIGNVSNRPLFNVGAKMYKDATIRFRSDTTYIYNQAGDSLTIDATDVTFTGTINGTNLSTMGNSFWNGSFGVTNDLSVAYHYTEDFIAYGIDTTAAGLLHVVGWNTAGDAAATLTQAAGTLGGWIVLGPVTGSNNESYHQLGELGTETYLEYVDSSGFESWVEFRLNPNSVATAGNLVFGLASEGAAAANFIDDGGADIADVDFVGFALWEAEMDSAEQIYQTTGGAFVVNDSTLVTASATSYGLYFDGNSTLSYYIGGTAVSTVLITAAGFPDGEELSPIIGIKQGAADRTVSVDWIKIVNER